MTLPHPKRSHLPAWWREENRDPPASRIGSLRR